jgi:hypothetical protein
LDSCGVLIIVSETYGVCWAALGQNAIRFILENELLFETESSCGSLQKGNGEFVLFKTHVFVHQYSFPVSSTKSSDIPSQDLFDL